MKVGDLVKMKIGYSSHGVILHMDEPMGSGRPHIVGANRATTRSPWVQILWSDAGKSNERMKDLEVIQYGNR
jgi:hypothetical protein